MAETGSQNRAAGDDGFSQAMLRILERVAGPSTSNVGRGSVTERLRSNGAEIFNSIAGVALNVAEYWMEATESRFKKKPKADGPIRVRAPAATARPQFCADSGKRHQGECWRKLGACLRCGPLEHRVKDCPRRPNQVQATGMGTGQPQRGVQEPPIGRGQARGGNGFSHGRRALGSGVGYTEARQPVLVYAARHREDGDAPDVIMGTFFIHKVPYTALIDIGYTHSYVDCTVTEKLGIPVENTPSGITILSPLRQSVRVNKLFRDVPLEIRGVVFLTDHMELSFGEFNLILSIDWLVKHRVRLDCATKRVVLRTEADEEVVVIGERWNYLSNVISALRVKKFVRKGCEAFLAYVSVLYVSDSSIKDIRMVKDFLDVFLEELPGLPPERRVEFGIELFPGTTPVSIALYRMALKELVELKAQI
ncbi:uncharacterized protein [Gossypium hirsutum]|uniref:DNA/RNA polymerases superfamily protein n=1 Tax=Gossypium hirsutum TaxID=3635 RepID=A0A1U8PP60_GOSHI|nr:uncharacterized protein LOC107960315 [Gossypium hirsutum]